MNPPVIKNRSRVPSIPFVQLSSTAFMMASIAGFIDVFAFVKLSKLFTAHITGNIVIAIAEIISHSPGVAAKLIALPVFMLVAMIATWVIEHIGQTKFLLTALFLVEAALLMAFMIAGYFILRTRENSVLQGRDESRPLNGR